MDKNNALIIAVLVAFFCAAAFHHAVADIRSNMPVRRTPQFAVTISDMMMLVRQQHQPAACAKGLDGELAMTSKAQVCICDAESKQWKNMGTSASCAW